ncbi:hypothetical protein BC834DRAFT_908436 [Gloeopeniophorella convolvens]|nr:hypothetical protein BC834DRAFT_908436 [Gloeopeniophorella convolvens]
MLVVPFPTKVSDENGLMTGYASTQALKRAFVRSHTLFKCSPEVSGLVLLTLPIIPWGWSPNMDNVLVLVLAWFKYLTAIGTAALLWDHVITFDDEVKFIWTGRLTKVKAMFVIQRYGMILVCIAIYYATYGIKREGDKVSLDCQALTTFVLVFGVWTRACTNYVVVSRLYVLWDYRRPVILALTTFSILAGVATTVMALVTDLALIRTVLPEPLYFHTCTYPVRPSVWLGDWGFQVVFDVITLGLTVFSAMTRPPRIEAALITEFLSEGFILYLFVFVARLLSLVLAFIPDVPDLFIIATPLNYTASTIAVTRLVLHLERIISLSSGHRQAPLYPDLDVQSAEPCGTAYFEMQTYSDCGAVA